MLLDAWLNDSEDGTVVDMAEPRIKACVLFTPLGKSGANISTFAVENYPSIGLEFAEMRNPSSRGCRL